MSNADEQIKLAMADLTVGDLGTGGKLRPEQADTFFRRLWILQPYSVKFVQYR